MRETRPTLPSFSEKYISHQLPQKAATSLALRVCREAHHCDRSEPASCMLRAATKLSRQAIMQLFSGTALQQPRVLPQQALQARFYLLGQPLVGRSTATTAVSRTRLSSQSQTQSLLTTRALHSSDAEPSSRSVATAAAATVSGCLTRWWLLYLSAALLCAAMQCSTQQLQQPCLT